MTGSRERSINMNLDQSFHHQTVVLDTAFERTLNIAPNVHLNILEICSGEGTTRLSLGAKSSVQHVRISLLDQVKNHLIIDQAQESTASIFTVSALGELKTTLKQNEQKALSRYYGLSLIEPLASTKTEVEMMHFAPLGQSEQLFKALISEQGEAFFRGRIHIAPFAQKVDSKQKSAALLLGPRAHIETMPELEILADDVKAAHGATVGQMDPEQLFYLQSRGLSLGDSVRLISESFINEIFFFIEGLEFRTQVQKKVEKSIRALEAQFVSALGRK